MTHQHSGEYKHDSPKTLNCHCGATFTNPFYYLRAKHCASCNKELKPVGGVPTRQYYGALPIRFYGGYGMYYDDLDISEPQELIICEDCADKLIEENLWIAKAIKRMLDGEQ